jgi:hypothetical protein
MASSSGNTGAGSSASGAERKATSPSSTDTPPAALAPAPRLRSCVVCRKRKVRCDKQSPCSNCRRANIACVSSSTNGPPRWARRYERIARASAGSDPVAPHDANPGGVTKVIDRLRNLESLVKELSGQLEQAHAAASSVGGGSSGIGSPESSNQDLEAEHRTGSSPAADSDNVQKHFGRLVLQDSHGSRYVSSGFWSRVNDEVSRL